MRILAGTLAALLLLGASSRPAAAQAPVVRAILFYSPTCPHCHQVINQDLPPLRQKYGDAFQVVGVDVNTPDGQQLYEAVVEYFALPTSRLGVPCMVVGLNVMVGSQEIPDRLPGIIDRGLIMGGIDWPPVAAVQEVFRQQGLIQDAPPAEAAPPTDTASTAETDTARADEPQPSPEAAPRPDAAAPDTTPAEAAAAAPEADPGATTGAPAAAPTGAPPEAPGADAQARAQPDSGTLVPPVRTDSGGQVVGITADLGGDSTWVPPAQSPVDRLLNDPVANGLAVGVFLLLLVALGLSAWSAFHPGTWVPRWPGWAFPLLAVAGMGIAAYLSFVEVTGAQAVCGPVGDCNTVQQSPYAHLFGVIPVGLLGLAGYVGLLLAWGTARWGAPALRTPAWTAAWAMAWVGTAFSAYLTFLEPFVIGATCAWCVSSALIMTAMLAAATGEMNRRGSANV